MQAFSNYGYSVDVLAPGEEIYSTSIENEYYYFSGTSISAAYVSGIAALIKSNNPEISIEEMVNTIKGSVRKFSDYENKISSSGIVDAYAALSNDIAPISDANIFEASENEKFEALDSNIEGYSLETDSTTFIAGGEIEPIVAQNVHYGESEVNPASGNFSFSVKDFEDSAPGMNFVFERYYNALDQDREKAFGCGWSSVLDSKIRTINNNILKLSVILPNGSSHKFIMEDGVYTSNTTRDTLTKDSSTQFTLTTKEQVKYIFNGLSSGRQYKLTEIKDKTGNTVLKILYDQQYGFVSGIYDSAGRKYTITYSREPNEGLNVSSITDPYGRTVYYDYTSSSAMSILTSFTDIMGNETMYTFWQKDNASSQTECWADTDIFLCEIHQKEAGKSETKRLLWINYDVRSYSTNYGKVMSYVDANGDTYTYTYKYMYTIIDREENVETRTEWYDSYMYIYKTDISGV